MAEVGVDLSQEFPKPLTDEFVRAADAVITMGCGDACPIYPGKRYEDWELDDPAGKDVETVRRIRDEIEQRVRTLLDEIAPAGDTGLTCGGGPLAEGFAAFALVFAGCGAIVADAQYGGTLGAVGVALVFGLIIMVDGLRHRPPLGRAHQPGGDDRVRAHPSLPGPRGRRLRRRAGRRGGLAAPLPARGLAREARRSRRHGADRRRRQRARLRAAS